MNKHERTAVSFDSFQEELNRLAATFEKGFKDFTAPDYSEARLREDFLNPLFRALGWDMENKLGLVQSQREVEIESRTDVAGRAKRADYLFRVENRERFVCEAKKPREVLGERYAFQAKRYAWNKGLPLAVLSDFEEIKIYVVGGKPHIDRAEEGLWKTWNFRQYPLIAQEFWDLLARERVAGGSIEALLDSLPKAKPAKGKARQQWLIRPERTKGLDQDFLEYLDEQRRALASDLLNGNNREDILADGRINEAAQRILDRLLFLRICEDRDIDTGSRLAKIVETWRRAYGHEDQRKLKQGRLLLKEESAEYKGAAPRESLWWAVVSHLRALDRRPPSNMPFFNGNLFKPHFSEDLRVGDQWLCDFIEEISADESPYLFSVIPVEILGSVYERFLGKVVRPQGRGVTIEEKPEVRKAGGVYYTPRYIVDYIVEQTVGKQLDAIAKENKAFAAFDKKTRALKILDPACGSGSFLIRAFERVCEHYQRRFTANPADRKPERCWTDPGTGDVHLTVDLKRRILRDNIYGVDLDAQAVEVTQLSLYLKMLEGEDRATIKQQRELFHDDTALLPPLEENIKHGNSLIASDFSLVPEDLTRVHAFDWDVQFAEIMKGGGFDAVIGNPPYLYSAGQEYIEYFKQRYRLSEYQTDFYTYFIEKALALVRQKGKFSFVVSDSWMKAENFSKLRNHLLSDHQLLRLAVFDFPPFEGATIENSVLVVSRGETPQAIPLDRFHAPEKVVFQTEVDPYKSMERGLIDPRYSDRALRLVEKIEHCGVRLDGIVELNRGIHAYRTDGYGKSRFSSGAQTKRDKEEQSYHSNKRLNSTYLPEIKGKDVYRFEFIKPGIFLSYGEWLAEPREPKYFINPKIVVRKVLGTRLHGAFIQEPMAIDQSLYVLISPANNTEQLKYILSILMSGIGAWYLRTKYAIYDTLYPWYTKKQLAAFPIAKHEDKLVGLVDKMLALVPKLRAETSESKRKTLQNAVDATDRQIDRLVYELYGLTEDEIRIVEGGAQ